MEKIDVLFINCTAYTMERPMDMCNWIAVRDGIIIDYGIDDYNQHIPYSNEVVDLEGLCVVPGFYDCHSHLVQTGINLEYGVDLFHANSIEEILGIITERANSIPNGKLIRGIHIDINGIREKRYPTRKELDMASPNNPVFINSREFHTSIINSSALSVIDLPYNLEGIARDERNLPLGILQGKASAFVRNKVYSMLETKARKKGVDKAVFNAVKSGVTSMHAMEGGYTFHRKDAEFVLSNHKSFPIDIALYYQSFDINTAIDNNLKRIGGDLFLDGSFYSYTAALEKPYSDTENNRGKLYYNDDELISFIYDANEHGVQTAFHAIGSRAIEQIISSHEAASNKSLGLNLRHRIEHFELATDRQIDRAAKLNMVASMQPAFEYYWGFDNDLYDLRLGRERAQQTNRFRYIQDSGIKICGGSDSDVTEINPLLGIHTAVNHPKSYSSVDVHSALEMFTINGAYASFEDDIKGSIAIGKYADFVVLDQNIFKVDVGRIKDIKVNMTIKQGNIIYTQEDI